MATFRIRLMKSLSTFLPFFAALTFIVFIQTAPEETIIVTTQEDELNMDGDCSLREAVRAANLDTAVDACLAGNGADTIILSAGFYILSIAGSGEDNALTGDLDIRDDLVIEGSGSGTTIISGAEIDRVFHIVDANLTVTISDLMIQNGYASTSNGGGIYSKGLLELVGIVIDQNKAFLSGGGIFTSNGSLAISNSIISNNETMSDGGGIRTDGTNVNIVATTIRDNIAATYGGGARLYNGINSMNSTLIRANRSTGANGGGVYSTFTGTTYFSISNSTFDANIAAEEGGGLAGEVQYLTNSTFMNNSASRGGGISGTADNITNSSFSGNYADEYGGGFYGSGGTDIVNSTFSGNSAAQGGGVYEYSTIGSIRFKNTIVANNIAGGDCRGQTTTLGFNIDSDGSCDWDGIGDMPMTDPLLGPLQDNGGPTLTHALQSDSPAIDAGAVTACPETDQRGYSRPQGAGCDIGAYEYQLVPPPTPTPIPQSCTSPQWLILVYLNGDNNLFAWTHPLFNKLELAADNPCIQILALWDGSGVGDTTLYLVQPDSNPFQLANYTDNVNRWPQGELNMGDGQTLIDFVNEGRSGYPLEHTLLSIVDHGNGWSVDITPRGYAHTGMSFDDNSDGDYLTTQELEMAFNQITDAGANKLDVVFYDACLMAMMENLYPLRNTVDFILAAENEAFTSYPYDDYLNSIGQNTLPPDLAITIADQYYESLDYYPRTMTAVNLNYIDVVALAVDSLSQLLLADLDSYEYAILESFADVQKFDSNVDLVIDERDSYVDLYHFAELLQQNISDPQIQIATQAVMDAVDSAVLHERHSSGTYSGDYWNLQNSTGISIYLPLGEINEILFPKYTADELSFLADTMWDELVFLLVEFAQPPGGGGDPIDPNNRPGPLTPEESFLPFVIHDNP